ncbi:MAG: aminotransferase class V-fold PLP-dependent enzyme [Cyanobacteria bacterium P01_D01_bin.156]
MTYYFDHAATGLPRAPAALKAATRAMNMGSAQRGIHQSAMAASEVIARARDAIAPLIGVSSQTHAVCFLPSTTAALNQTILGIRPRPRRIAIDPLAHNAAYRPVMALAQQQGIPYWILPNTPEGLIDCSQLAATWQTDTDVVVLTHASNVTGIVQPVDTVISMAHQTGAKVVIDAAQTVGVINTHGLAAADAIAFGGHKGLRSLPGVGVLAVSHGLTLEPLIYGGTGGEAAAETMPELLPQRLEAGTPNLPAIAAMSAQAANVTKFSKPDVLVHDLREAVTAGGGQIVTTSKSPAVPIVSFTLPGIIPSEAADILERCFDIQLRSGLHCAPLAHRTLGTFPNGTLRVSTGVTTAAADLEQLTQALQGVSQSYRQILHV